MNIVCMENAWPIDAASVTAPLPKNFILLSPDGALANIHIKKIQYPTQLIIP